MNDTTMLELIEKAKVYEAERQASFANPPKNCAHELVYYKHDDDVHCQYCDKFMYTDRGDYDD